VTGSYFFSDTKNNTEELVRTQFVSGSRSFSFDTTTAESNNTSHRVNMRLEYKIDSNNTLIITPNLSFQKNESERRVARSYLYTPGNKLDSSATLNFTNSARNANNLNNSILFRHSFPKRGRTISFNFRTSYNQRDGETYVNTSQQSYFSSGLYDDSVSQRFTDQFNNGLQLSGNLNYTEPVGKEAQLQISYNPSVSKNTADQKAYAWDTINHQYSSFINNLSSEFENKTTAQNGGISYRWGNRDRLISFGANYQQTRLESDQVLPRVLSVDKSFSNVLPNAMVRYKLSPKSSIRVNYRANVNQPSVTQLQGVVDPNNAPNYSEGNPNLEQQYTHVLSSQYTFTNTQKGLLLVGNLFYQNANNYITNAIFNIDSTVDINGVKIPAGSQLSRPVNLDGYSSIRSFVTYAMPIKLIKSNFNLNGGYTFSKLPGYIDTITTTTRANTFTLGSVVSSNISQYIDFTISYSGNFNKVNSESVNRQTKQIETAKDQYYNHVASLQMNLLSKKGWFFQNDVSNLMTRGLSEGFNQNYVLWNMGAGKKFLPQNKGELKISVFDLLKQNRSINRTITETGNIEDTRNVVLQQYFMLTFSYNLKNFGTAAARQANRQQQGGR
jgi:Outer membrane protein beta-barrel family